MVILSVFLALALFLGAWGVVRVRGWKSLTREIRRELALKQSSANPGAYDPVEIASLPPPVRRYFETVLRPGQPMITGVSMEHVGEINLGSGRENWKPFVSTQRVTTDPPGFDWYGRVRLGPGIAAEVHDAYVGGRGILCARAAGIVTLVHANGTPEVNKGELMRYLAEGAWYPTALLPSRGISWEAVDDVSARAILADGDTEVALLFHFTPSGLIESVLAEDRPMMDKGSVRPMRWEGRWRGEITVDGIRVPAEGEVAWLLSEGRKPYWRGRVTRITYEFSGAEAVGS
ncbi:MAG TPA: hypothetical protein PLO53_07500 [Candidatus Hydrogenedentes bacterium]|nr:hypothetical protein [Candidatus Hydrogenedentota bacterium]